MVAVTVALPDKLKQWLDEQIEDGELADASSYVSDLISRDRAKRNDERLEALRRRIDESLASGVSPLTMDDIWEQAVTRARELGVYRE